jgi:hypothetical protein
MGNRGAVQCSRRRISWPASLSAPLPRHATLASEHATPALPGVSCPSKPQDTTTRREEEEEETWLPPRAHPLPHTTVMLARRSLLHPHSSSSIALRTCPSIPPSSPSLKRPATLSLSLSPPYRPSRPSPHQSRARSPMTQSPRPCHCQRQLLPAIPVPATYRFTGGAAAEPVLRG